MNARVLKMWRVWFVLGFAGFAGAADLTVYTYESLAGKGGLGPVLKEAFKKKYGKDVELVSFGSAGEALNQILLEKKHSKADVLLGLDNHLAYRAKQSGLFASAPAKLLARVPEDFKLDPDLMLPFNYGYLAFVYDKEKTKDVPEKMSLQAFAEDSRWKKRVVVPDPRTSSLGLSFLSWTHLVFHSKTSAFWGNFRNQVFTFPSGWSAAYGLFLEGQADFVLSYTTSPAYHVEKEAKQNIKALLFNEGQYLQIEGAAIVAHSKRPELAQKWMELLLSPEIQKKIPLTNWMYPIVANTPLPESYSWLPKVTAIVPPQPLLVETSKDAWIKEWEGLFVP